ncbi:MAG: ferritin-like domain-containing protein [Candidatus Binatia bacterium]
MAPSNFVAAAYDSLEHTYDSAFLSDYSHVRTDLSRLYNMAKQAQWDATTDLDWSRDVDPEKPFRPVEESALYGTRHWNKLTEREKLKLNHEYMAWTLSQFLHGEQGALMATAQIVDSVPNIDAKLYAATQVMDEARHVEAYDRYLHEKLEIVYPVNPELRTLLDQILRDSRWDMKYLGMQILVEGLALAAFQVIRDHTYEPLLCDITAMVMKDEARHVAFGVLSLKDYYKELTEPEVRERVEFVYEGCRLMRDRLLGREVYEKMGMDVRACIEIEFRDEMSKLFRRAMFSKIVPNVKKLGLLTDDLRRGFEELGVLEYENLPSSEEEVVSSDATLSRLLAGDQPGAVRMAS